MWSVLDDVVADQRREMLPEASAGFAEVADQHLYALDHVGEALRYYGQTRALFDALDAAWHTVTDSDDVLPWAIDEMGNDLLDLVRCHYLETAAEPRGEEPALVEALSRYGEPNPGWYDTAVRCVSAPAPSPWRPEDFDETVDAERWESNVEALLFEFVSDLRRRRQAPLSKGELARDRLGVVRHRQFVHPQ